MTRTSGRPGGYGEDIATAGRLPATGAPREGGLTLQAVGEGIFSTQLLPRQGEVLIGRSSQADLVIDDESISRRHARLIIGSSLTIEDLGSANGTIVAGRRIEPHRPARVEVGEVIDLGSVMLIVQRDATTARPRRLWNHDYFEGRLDDECTRAAESAAQFAVAHLHVEGELPAEQMRSALAARLRSTEIVGSYGPGHFELLLLGEERYARDVLDGLAADLVRLGGRVAHALACYPRDGRTAESLVAAALGRLRSGTVGEARPPSAAIVESAVMRRLLHFVGRIAAGRINVLLLGETGVGKEVMAETVHRLSPRASGPFVRINCAALAPNLIESELFGHEKGAFTGAGQAKAGLLETADAGTVFLDEVGEIPSELQAKLLRVIETRQVRRVGGRQSRTIDVRFVSATNRDLDAEVASGWFRRDLLFRLNGATVMIPPLRERLEEVEPLCRRFLAESAADLGRAAPAISKEALAALKAYSWPGNIRELRNVIERAVLLCGDSIAVEHLPAEKMALPQETSRSRPLEGRKEARAQVREGGLREQMGQVERELVADAIDRCGGNQSRAAKLLGISRNALVARLDEHNLPRPRKRGPDER